MSNKDLLRLKRLLGRLPKGEWSITTTGGPSACAKQISVVSRLGSAPHADGSVSLTLEVCSGIVNQEVAEFIVLARNLLPGIVE